jgi:hypothetical protein
VNLALAAVGWWLAREGLRDWTMLDTNDGGLFVKGARTRVAQRAASTEIVHRHLTAADLTALVAEHAQATGAGARQRRGT